MSASPENAGNRQKGENGSAAPPHTRARAFWFGLLTSPWFVFAALVAVFFFPAITAGSGNFIAGHDIIHQDYWNRAYISSRVADGEWPLWCSHYYAGHPFSANSIANLYYPPAALYLVAPLPLAFTGIVLLHIWLAGVGMFYLMRRLTASAAAGWGAGVAYAFSGYMIDRIDAGHPTFFQPAALLPWLILLLDRALVQKRMAPWVGAGVFFGCLILGSVPQNSFYIALVVICYSGLWLGSFARAEGWLAWRRAAGGLTVLFAFAFAVAAVQILPTLELARVSDRAEASFEFSSFFSYPAIAFARYLVPHMETEFVPNKWEFTGYVGVTTLILAGLAFSSRERRRQAVIFAVLSLLSVSVMLGDASPLFYLYFKLIPGFDLFRIPSRATILLVFCLCALAGLGIKRLFEEEYVRANLKLASALGGLALCAVAALTLGLDERGLSGEFVLSAMLCLAPAGLLAVRGRLSKAWLVSSMLSAVLFFDLLIQYSHFVPIHSESEFLAPQDWEAPVLENPGLYRVAMPAGGSRGKVFGYHDVNGYEAIVHGEYMKFVYGISEAEVPKYARHTVSSAVFYRPHPEFGQMLSLRYAINYEREFLEFPCFERAYLVGAAEVEPGFERQLERIKEGSVDLSSTVLLDHLPLDAADGTPATVSSSSSVYIAEHRPERITIDFEATKAGYLTVNELFYPGWFATIDGEETEIVRANAIVRAVRAPAGRHRVVFEYRPASFRFGLAISLAALLGAGGIPVVRRIRERAGADSTEAG